MEEQASRKTRSVTFALPTEEEALKALSGMLHTSGMTADHQLAWRCWFSDVLEDAKAWRRRDAE